MNQKDNATKWHEEAMDLAEMAFFAKRRREFYNYLKLLQRALNLEKAAAKQLESTYEIEPSRSVLYLGTANLALDLDHFEEAKQLINEALEGNPVGEIKQELQALLSEINKREEIKSRALIIAQSVLEGQTEVNNKLIQLAIDTSLIGVEGLFGKETIDQLLNRIVLEVSLESKNSVSNPEYQIFEYDIYDKRWIEEKKKRLLWNFWKAYKVYLDKKGYASTTIKQLDLLTDDVLGRIGDPLRGEIWNKRGLIVGDVQSGKTSNYIGLANKAADLGYKIIIILTGLYENLRQQTQQRVDEGFIGFVSDLKSPNAGNPIGVEVYRTPKNLPVHPITRAGDAGDLRKSALPNLPINTSDYYAIVVKKNPVVLKTLLNWLHARGSDDGQYKIIKNIPLLVIDDEADYASLNIDKEFVSKINGSIRAILALFEKSAFVGYTATPFANVFISDPNETKGKEIIIDRKHFRLGEDLFPKDFIINLPSPSNYIGYSKVFDTISSANDNPDEGELLMVNIINDFESFIPKGHKKDETRPIDIPDSLKAAVKCFIIVCSVRLARGQTKEHNSMLIHASWYVSWIDRIAWLVNTYLNEVKELLKTKNQSIIHELKLTWEKEFQNQTNKIIHQLDYNDPHIIEHTWDEILQYIVRATDKIEVRSVHGAKKNLEYNNVTPLNYSDYRNGLSVITVGGNKLSRGLTLEGLSISYFLRATRIYDTLLQMGRWFGYRPGYVDLCRLFTTDELVTWYQYIANATDELKEQFDIMDAAERTPDRFGLKVRSAPGMLTISSAAKIKSAVDLSLSFSGDLLETYVLSKTDDTLISNLNTFNRFLEKLGKPSGITRQQQPFIWENVSYSIIDGFISHYVTNQASIYPDFIRGYIGQQLKNNDLSNWTVVVINNSKSHEGYGITTPHYQFDIGCTYRKEEVKEDAFGNPLVDPKRYWIRKSHILSPPHEFLDMDETDSRYIDALNETRDKSKSIIKPAFPAGKYVRKYRGSKNVLLLIYLLDPAGFNGTKDLPSVGFALSFPEIKNDEKIPYMVNQRFIEEFGFPAEAEENFEEEEELV